MGCDCLGCACGKCVFPQRFVMVMLCAFGIIVVYGQRVNLNLIITVMVMPGNKTSSAECAPANVTKAPETQSKQYQWTEFQQQMLLGIFFIGYFVNHIPGGYLADRYGSRLVFSVSILVSSILTLLSPPTVHYTYYWVFLVVRFLIGVFQAPTFPPVTTLMARWIPKHERATVGGIIFAANSLGIVFGALFSGMVKIISEGWEPVFYFWGLIGVLWFVFMMLYVYSDPATHPHITQKEKEKLEASIIKKEAKVKLNWCSMMADPAVWALIAGQYGHAWMIFFLSTNMPKYYKDVLHYDIKRNTLVQSLPCTLQWVSSVICGKLGDWMIKKKGYNVALIRKAYTTVASVGPSVCLVLIPYLGCAHIWVTVLLCMSFLLMGPFYCGLKVNVIDLTINFSGILMAIVNGLGAISGFVSPYIVAMVAPDNTLFQWKIVMWTIFGGASITNIIYIIWGGSSRSKWDMMPEEWKPFKEQKDKDKAEKKAAKKAAKDDKKAQKNEKGKGKEHKAEEKAGPA